MNYASFGILAVILHFIINKEIIRDMFKRRLQGAYYRYGQFLRAILIFYIADLLWGFLVDLKLRTLAYWDTVLFFAMMALSLLLWTRFVVAYVNAHGIRSNIFIAAGWCIFVFVLLHLIVNIFNPIVFMFTEKMVYIPGRARYIFLSAQIILFVSISLHSFLVSRKRSGEQSMHYLTIGVTGAVMALCVLLQSLDAFFPFYTVGCLLANCLIHVFVEEEQYEIVENTNKEKERYSHIANSLARDYDAIYYIDIESGQFFELSTSDMYAAMKVPQDGKDFYEETRQNVRKYVHPDDRKFAESLYSKDAIKKKLEGRNSYNYRYRVMVDGTYHHFSFNVILSEDKTHLIVCDKDITDAVIAEKEQQEKQKAQVTFAHIAESLALNYDVIFYVNILNNHYVRFTTRNIFGKLQAAESGVDFFDDAKKSMANLIYHQDAERMKNAFVKNYILKEIEGKKQLCTEYRLCVEDTIQYTRLIVRKTSDGNHLILGIENIDDEVKKEIEFEKSLQKEKEVARRDELTGVKNKLAFDELEKTVQADMDQGKDHLAFAIIVCDLNDLKRINDTLGHKAGDLYITTSSKLLCDTFVHSPVFRIGGDEFAIFLKGSDYDAREQLVEKIQKTSIANKDRKEGPVIAIGMADFTEEKDKKFTEVFERADRRMYENKNVLKAGRSTRAASF